MKINVLSFLILCAPVLTVGCATSDPTKNDFNMMQSVYKQQSLKDQQTINDLRRELDAVQRDLKTAAAARAASDVKLSESLRRIEQQREELARAKDERTQLASQQTTQIAPIVRQLTEELARTREDRAQFSQTMKLLSQHIVELEHLKQAQAPAGQDPGLQSVETALNKHNEALAALRSSVEGVQESLEAQRQAQKAQPEAFGTPSTGKRKTKTVPIPPATKDNAPGPKDSDSGLKESALGPKDHSAAPKDSRSAAQTHTVIVKAGDTLKSLAEKYGMTPAQLKEMNRLTTDDIQVGQSLTVPAVTKSNTP